MMTALLALGLSGSQHGLPVSICLSIIHSRQRPSKPKSLVTMAVLASPEEAAPEVRLLPPQDRGRKAWLFLAGVSVLEITTWGENPSYRRNLPVRGVLRALC